MQIVFDSRKRETTLRQRGLDFADAGKVFGGKHFTVEDLRTDYGEHRFVTVGCLGKRMVVITWTQRGDDCRVISMKKANERKRSKWAARPAG
jgi:hypothetical protein